MFELTQPTKAKMLNVIVLSQKNRKPDDDPGAKLSIEMQLPASMMGHFASRMPGIFFEAPKVPPKQAQLDGVEPASETPNLTEFGLKVKCLTWEHEMTGYTLVIVLGTARKESNITIGDGTLSGWKLYPKEGGTVIARYFAESADVSAETFGRLAKLKSRDIEITLAPPVITQQDLVRQQEREQIPPAPARKPGAAEKAAVAKVKGAGALPKPTPHKGTEVKRTARGAAKTKEALEKGAADNKVTSEPAWPLLKDNELTPAQKAAKAAAAAQASKATAAFVAGSEAKH